jgi:hypothetical protein
METDIECSMRTLHKLESIGIISVKKLLDTYRNNPELLFVLSQKCWRETTDYIFDEYSNQLKNVKLISYQKMKLIIRKKKLQESLTRVDYLLGITA